MKSILSLLFVVVLLPFLTAQDCQVTYRDTQEFQGRSDFEQVDPNLLRMAMDRLKAGFVADLSYCSGLSFYHSPTEANLMEEQGRASMNTSLRRFADVVYHKDFANQLVYKSDRMNAPGACVVIPFSSYHWQIDPADSKTVLGYPCRRATCNYQGQEIVAWFAEEIPIPDGPRNFAGLPGLILLLEDGITTIEAERITFDACTDSGELPVFEEEIDERTFNARFRARSIQQNGN